MKRIFFLLVILLSISGYAQQYVLTDSEHPTLIKSRLDSIEKHNKAFNLYFNFQGSLDATLDDSNQINTHFKARQFRLEIMGNITDKLFYRFRHRLNRSNIAQSLDNMAKATDMMYIGYKATDKLSLIAGKQTLVWGGFEFDQNPIHIYQYSDFGDNLDHFMLGASVRYLPVTNHELVLQVANSTNAQFKDEYPQLLPNSSIKPSKTPLTYIANWNGSMLNNTLQTRWAYGLQTLANSKFSKMITIGNKVLLPKFHIALDYMRADEDIDRLKIASNDARAYLFANNISYFKDVTYIAYMAKVKYFPVNKWEIFAQAMYETASVDKVPEYENYRKAIGYLLGTEFRPFDDKDFSIFATYVGRSYHFSDKLMHYTDIKNYNTNRFSLGIIYRLKAF